MSDLARQLKRLIDSGLKDEWIANHLNVELQVVLDAHYGIFPATEPKRTRKTPAKFVHAVRPFPTITDDMHDTMRILLLAKHGLSAKKIAPYLSSQTTPDAINRYARKILGPMRKGSNSLENNISPSFMPYVHECLERLGKDRFTCELCLEPVPKGCNVHHTKYQGATVYDLMYICTSCNLSRENKGLL